VLFVALLTSVVLSCKIQCTNLYNIEVIISTLMCSIRVILLKNIYIGCEIYKLYDIIEAKLVILSVDLRFSLSLSLSKGGALHYPSQTTSIFVVRTTNCRKGWSFGKGRLFEQMMQLHTIWRWLKWVLGKSCEKEYDIHFEFISSNCCEAGMHISETQGVAKIRNQKKEEKTKNLGVITFSFSFFFFFMNYQPPSICSHKLILSPNDRIEQPFTYQNFPSVSQLR
jgi:hypothetical protein